MNFSTTARRTAQGLLALCLMLVSAADLKAQCSDFISYPIAPVTINLTLDATGDVQLTNAVLNANGFVKNGPCDYWLSFDPDPTNVGAYAHTPINFTCNPPPASPYGVGTYTMHVRVGGGPPFPPGVITDLGGPGATVVDITVNVYDNIFPTMTTAAGPFSRNADAAPPGSCRYTIVPGDVADFNPSAFGDNCLSPTVQFRIDGGAWTTGTSVVGQVLIGSGAHTIQWRVFDASNNITVKPAITVTVMDATPPIITCPADQVVGTDNTLLYCGYSYVGGNATATDNCGPTTITNNFNATSSLSGAIIPAGAAGASLTTNVTWTATAPGGSVMCTQMITVADNDAPVFSACPMNLTVNAIACNYTGTAALNPTASDNCSAVTYSNSYDATNTLAGKVFPQSGSPYIITWTATDAQGNNTNNCTFTLTVVDVTPPVVVFIPSPPSAVSFQASYTVNAAPGSCSQNVSWYRPSPLTHNATDCSGLVSLQEGVAVVNGNPDLNFFISNGVSPYPYQSGFPLDYSTGNFLHWVTPISANFSVGTTVIPYTFSDASGNITVVNVTITVLENQPPGAACVAGPISIPIDPLLGVALVPAGLVNNGSTDNCGIATMTVSPTFFDCTAIPTNNTPANNVTLTVTDNAGNMATCVTNIFVYDNTLPVIGCPSSFNVAAGPACNATVPSLIFNAALTSSVGVQEYFDNAIDPCGLLFDYKVNAGAFVQYNMVPITSGAVNLSALVFPAGLNTVTIRAKDGSNNIGACTFSVNVQDNTPPTYSGCPANITMDANTGGCGKSVSWTPPTYTDNCTSPVPPATTTHSPGTFFLFGTTTVTYTANDAAGNINNTCTFTVTINDIQAPVANCKNATVTLGAGGTVNMPASAIDNNSTDNCFYTYQTDPYTFNCTQVGTPQVVTLTIVDAGGLTASCQATVTVQDGQIPVALCNLIPATLNLSAGSPGQVTMNAASVGNATDNCLANVTYQISVDGSAFANSFTFNCSHIGPRMVTLKATDSAGSNNCGPVTVTIRDVSAPAFTVPAGIILDCNSSNPNLLLPSNTGMPTNIVDNCDGAPTVTYSDLTSNVPGCPNALNIVRTWTVADHATPVNSFSQTQNIQVRDITPPVWTLGTTFTTNTTGPNVCSVPSPIPAVIAGSNVSDACGSFSVTYGIVFPAGSVPATVAPGTPLPLNGLLTQLFPIGVSTVTFIAVDACGNAAPRTVTVTVNDVNPPVFNYSRCNQTYTLPNTTNACSQLYAWTRPVAGMTPDIADCKIFTVTESINNATVQQFVNLVNPFGAWPPPNPNVVAQFPVGTTVITYTATDASNNTSTCSFNVVIQDTQAPSIVCPGNQTLSITAGCTGITTIPNYSTLATVTDNCLNNIIRTQTPTAGNLVSTVVPVVPGNTFTVTLKATDSQSLGLMSTTCSFNVTLVDGQAPTPDVLLLPDVVSFCGKDTVTAPSATDCNGVTFVTIFGTPSVPVMMTLPPLVPGGPPRYVLNAGNYVITWSYTDAQNNTTTQPQNVSIAVDLFPPTAICHADSINLNAAGTGSIGAIQLDNGSFDQDNCGPVTLSFRVGSSAPYTYVPTLNFSCMNLGVNAVVFAATDVNGNTATCATTVKVKDVIAPTIANVPANITVQACSPIAPQAVLTATDVCDSDVPVVPTQTTTQAASNEVCGFYTYTITRKWTATDDSGNTKTETQTITVEDTEAPIFSSPDSIVVLTDPNRLTCDDTVSLNMLNFLADCAPDSELVVINTLNPALGANVTGVYAVGSHVITFTATDKCGNSSTKSIKLVVKDVTLPTAVCINGVSVSLQAGGLVSIGALQVNNNSFDNCGTPLTFQVQRLLPLGTAGNSITFSCPDADAVTHHPVRLYVTDIHGNVSTCETFVVVQDNVAPTITCPANATVNCSANMTPAVLGLATATDNCPLLPSAISFGDSIATGTGMICKVLIRTWMARDLSGNLSSCNQLISIFDTIKPVLSSYSPDITISCSEPLPDPLLITATDNCSQNLVVTFQQDTTNIAAGACGKYDYTIVRTRTATDDCGNKETHVRLIKVNDVIPPAFPGMPQTLQIQSANFPANTNCTVPVTLDAAQYFVDCAPLAECTVNSIAFQPALAITPVGLNVSGNYPVGTTKVIFSVTDPCGNKGVDTIDIVVVDNSVPTLVCNDNVVIALGSNGNASIDPSDIDLGSTDNCGIDTLFLSQSTFDCADLGLNPVKLTAIDIYGNSNFCLVNVNVTLGSNAGFTLATTGTAETFFGAGNGGATAVATGGSGSFSYTWSTMDTIANLTGLVAGTYTVTVVDSNTGCVSIDTAIVSPGKKITVNVGTISGCQGQSIIVPVTVDNFINVTGFSFGLQLNNLVAGTITSITDVNAAILAPTLTANSIFWTNLTGVNLVNGSLLFNLHVQLSNAPTPVGTTSVVSPSALPTLAFLQDINSVPTQAGMIVFNNGSVTISCAAADIEVAGIIRTWRAPVLPIPGVNVALTGTTMGTDATTLPLADYSFLVPSGANTVVTPTKTASAKSTKINVGDLLFIQAHAAPPAVQIAFTSPYQWVAGDINGDNIVNIIDYALVQAYIVNNPPTDGHFHFSPAPPDWKFIPKAYTFPAMNPLVPTPPSSIANTNVTAAILTDDFVGVLLGDVNGDVVPTFSSNSGAEFTNTMKLRINERSVEAGEVVTIPFKASDFTNRQAYQLTISFDPSKFQLEGIENGILPGLSDDNFGTAFLNEGMISTLWVGNKPLTLSDNDVLFSLKFKALSNVYALSDVLHSSSDLVEALAIGQNGNEEGVDFEFVTSVGSQEVERKSFVLYQNQPNPFSTETTISFRLPEAGRAKLHIFGTDGRLVKTIIGDYPAGNNAVTIRKDEFGAPGVYWYNLETLKNSDRKKMILIN